MARQQPQQHPAKKCPGFSWTRTFDGHSDNATWETHDESWKCSHRLDVVRVWGLRGYSPIFVGTWIDDAPASFVVLSEKVELEFWLLDLHVHVWDFLELLVHVSQMIVWTWSDGVPSSAASWETAVRSDLSLALL